ncbi:ribbon-helix-helix, copG family protein [Lysobacter gummosus]|nr:ribbon-helix-helix, copG family protein [Lysobacter gummosus]
MQFLEELCVRKGVSKTAAIRQALRLYQVVEDRADKGKKMFFVDNSTKERSELMLL